MYKRKLQDKKRMEALYKETGAERWFIFTGVYRDSKKGRMVQIWRSHKSDMPRFYKRQAAKAVRNLPQDEAPANGASYRKSYDYKWELD